MELTIKIDKIKFWAIENSILTPNWATMSQVVPDDTLCNTGILHTWFVIFGRYDVQMQVYRGDPEPSGYLNI